VEITMVEGATLGYGGVHVLGQDSIKKNWGYFRHEMYLYLLVVVCTACVVSQNNKRGRTKTIDALMKRSAKYATMAQQDGSPMHSVVHANHAMAYLSAAGDIASPQEIHDATGIDHKVFRERVLAVQHEVTQRTIQKCPEFKGEMDLYLSSIADA
jgi:hypothetical protein